MRSRATFLGHPLHAMVAPIPLALLLAAFFFDFFGWLLSLPFWWTTGGHLAVAGILGALLVAVPGIVDYVHTVPPRSSAKGRATRHLVVNVVAVVCFAAAWWLRGGATVRPEPVLLALEAGGAGLLAIGGYLGGTLMTRNMIGIDHRYAQAGRWREMTVNAPPTGTIIAASADELQVDQMKLLRIDDRRIVLARTETGYVAFEDRCSHRGGSLAGGVMACGTVQCLWHGSQFDVRTGQVKAGPAETDIQTYPVEEVDGEVRLRI